MACYSGVGSVLKIPKALVHVRWGVGVDSSFADICTLQVSHDHRCQSFFFADMPDNKSGQTSMLFDNYTRLLSCWGPLLWRSKDSKIPV